MVYLLNFFIVENEFVAKYLPIIVLGVGTTFFVIYDLVMIRFQKYTNIIIKKLGI